MTVSAPAESYELNRMSPYDPSGAGRTLDAPEVRIDDQTVAADGTWPGFRATKGAIVDERFDVTVDAGEAVIITVHEFAR